jgi:hypothetical protein
MVKKRMAMRMVTIFVALIVCGMFFPDLARGDENLSSDKGYISEEGYIVVEFENLQLNEPSEIPVVISNDSDYDLRLILLFNQEAGCNFQYNGPYIQTLAPGDPLNVNFTYTPSDEDVCTAELQIMYSGSPSGVVIMKLIGDLEIQEGPKEIVIGTFPTGVLDREDEDGEYISDLISECQETADNPGHMVRCISRLTTHLRWKGIISCEEKSAIRKALWKAAMSNIMQEMQTAKRSGRRDHRSRFWWRDFHHWRH